MYMNRLITLVAEEIETVRPVGFSASARLAPRCRSMTNHHSSPVLEMKVKNTLGFEFWPQPTHTPRLPSQNRHRFYWRGVLPMVRSLFVMGRALLKDWSRLALENLAL